MANLVKWGAYPSATSYLTTELNSLANNARVIGAEIDNTSGRNRWMDITVYVAAQGSARTAGAYLAVYAVTAVDGTNYCYGDASTAPPETTLVAYFPLDAATTARYITANRIQLSPCKIKLIIANVTGQAFASSASTMSYTVYNEEVQ